MFKKMICVVAIAELILAIAPVAQAELITGVTVEDVGSELFVAGTEPVVNIINGTGLTVDGDGVGTVHDNSAAGSWRTTRTYSGGTDELPDGGYVTLNLGANYNLDSIHVWNFNNYAGSQMKDVEIWVSPDTVGNLVQLDNPGGDFVFPDATLLNDYVGCDVDLSGVVNSSALNDVRLVRFDAQTGMDPAWIDIVGLAEVQFFKVSAPELVWDTGVASGDWTSVNWLPGGGGTRRRWTPPERRT